MALDEALLRMRETPVLRLYRWLRPCLSFGYFGEFAEVRRRWPEWEHVRRWTGGGMVEHGDDFTYTLVVPRGWELARCNAPESYRIIHQAVAEALGARDGAAPSLSEEGRAEKASACFESPVKNDVLIAGRKVAGGAQRRTSHGLLHQGSIQALEEPGRREDFAAALSRALAGKPIASGYSAAEMAAAEELAREKYGSQAWLERY